MNSQNDERLIAIKYLQRTDMFLLPWKRMREIIIFAHRKKMFKQRLGNHKESSV